jgi:hypothetical protein
MAKLFSSQFYEYVSGECIDDKHAYLYPYDMPDVLMFVSVSKDTFVTDSIVGFNHFFAKYTSMEELEQTIRNKSFKRKYHLPRYRDRPVVYRKKDYYQLVTNYGVYEISFKNKEFIKKLKFERKKSGYIFKILPKDISIPIGHMERNIVHFFPEYTKIIFTHSYPSSYLILHNDGEITANIEPSVLPGYCLSVKKQQVEIETEIQKESEEWIEIAEFGLDCFPNSTIITYDGVSFDTLFNVNTGLAGE